MNWERLLRSPPPRTGWVLDATEAVVLHRTPAEAHCAVEALPASGFEIGSVGLQAVDLDAVSPVLARLKGATGGDETGAVVVPSSWLRSYLMDIDRAPRREDELQDVVRWRLKRLLPVPASEVRLSVVRLPEVEGVRRLLVMAGIERAVAAIEAAFTAVGIEIGMLTTRLFALVPRGAGGEHPTLVVQHEDGFLSLLLVAGSVPRLLRTKPLPSTGGEPAAVVREIGLNLSYIRDKIGVGDDIEVRFISLNTAVEAAVREFFAGATGLVSAPEALAPPVGPTTVVQRIGAAALAPAVAVVTGEVQ